MKRPPTAGGSLHPPLRWLPAAVMGVAGGAGLVLAAIVAFLVIGSQSGHFDWMRLITSSLWDPLRGRFGAAAMLWGTAAVAAVALLLATPVGWAAAVAINEMSTGRRRQVLRGAAELLAVVPSIVYGLLGVAYVRPLVAKLAGVPGGDSLLAAGVVLAVMVVPTIVAVSVDALSEVPASAREAARACGLTSGEVIRSAVLPQARRGMRAAVLLALARALGETIAVFLLVGRADGRMPSDLLDGLDRLIHPGQTLTTKLNGPEALLAGTTGSHWAALCGLGLLLLSMVAGLTILGQRFSSTRSGRDPGRAKGTTVVALAARGRVAREATMTLVRWAAVGLLGGLVLAVVVVVAVRGAAALDPRFWWTQSFGASGGGIRSQVTGTILLVIGAGALAAPVGLALGLVVSEYAGPRLSRLLRSLTLTLGGVPSILLGLWGYWFFGVRLGWGKSWLAGAVVLAVVAVPPVTVAVAAAVTALAPERREAALAAGLRRNQVVRSVLVPQALPALVTGLFLGLARAAGETAPLLFTATVFSGAPDLPEGIRQSPVASLPTHIFTLAQDAAEPAARRGAWGAALALVMVAGLLVLAAVPARRWARGTA